MKPLFWSMLLQWSRFGTTALVFLVATRVLSLHDFGIFATGFSVIKLTQGIHKAGVSETVVIKSATSARLHALFGTACLSGAFASLLYILTASWANFVPELFTLAIIPIFGGLSAVSDGLLRKRFSFRTLALRTLFVQSIATIVTFIALMLGARIGALVLFVSLNATLSAVLSITFAGWYPKAAPSFTHMLLSLRTVLHISGRDILNSGTLPITQLLIGVFLGSSLAGAFQIATRVLSMLDALTLAPIRYLTLPRLAGLKDSKGFHIEIQQNLKLCTICACWVWFGFASSTHQILEIVVGSKHAIVVSPILQALIPLGLGTAATMTFTQALMAKGATKLILSRALWTFSLSALSTILLLRTNATYIAIALSFTNVIVLIWFIKEASTKLLIQPDIIRNVLPAVFAGSIMLVIISNTNFSLILRIATGSIIYLLILATFSFRAKWRSFA